MPQVAVLPVAFSSLTRLIATASRFCGRRSSVLTLPRVRRPLAAYEVMQLALLAPELPFSIDVNATVMLRTRKPATVEVRYALADLDQVAYALSHLYRNSEPSLPMALDVETLKHRRCRLSMLTREGAMFEVAGELSIDRCAPDSAVKLELPHAGGAVELDGQVLCVTPRRARSQLHVRFNKLAEETRRVLDDIVFRFRLGDAPWTPRLLAPGV